jgi:Domain of Unknown Function with PDB structure (DUF3857)/Transglutaminase-like superfamily
MLLSRSLAPVVLSLACLFLLSATVFGGDEWRPIDPADLALKTAVVEKDADAEAIFWEVRVADENDGYYYRKVLNHYIRIKIFTERGRESQSRIDIPYWGGTSIKDVAARTIKADGSVIEIKKEDVLERTIVKAGGIKLKAKSFAMPAVEPGVIIEYRWKEVRDAVLYYDRFYMQREIPVQIVRYFIKPAHVESFKTVGLSAKTFHGSTTPFVKVKDGFYMTTMANVPAFHEESRMPPEDEVRAWMLTWYTDEGDLPPDKYWPKFGKDTYDEYKTLLKITDEVRNAAVQAIGDASTPDQKLERLYAFCQTKIKNVNSDTAGLTADERARLKENKTPADTLKRGMGTGWDIDLLFTAMADAAGMEARVVRIADRSDVFFSPNFANKYFLRSYDVAVRVGEGWRFLDPGSAYIPFGMLRWQEEGQKALILDPKEPIWVETPMSSPQMTKQRRIAKLSLSEDGTIEGDVRIEFTGQFGIERKRANDQDSTDKREETLRDEVKAQMSTAEISNLRIENVTDPVKPFVYNYHIKVPGYAQHTGKRLFLQPAFFEHGNGPLFATADRRYPVYFHYPWSEQDEVSISLPEGYALDNADAPSPITIAPITEYKPTAAITKDGKILIYKRNFFFGGQASILYPVKVYSQLKAYFDSVHNEDNHTISLKQNGAVSSNQ